MHESVKRKLLKDQRALLLGASDITQAIAAARALQVENDGTLARALETAMVISFMRPFTGTVRLPDGYSAPPGAAEAQLFDEMKALRDKVYAHTDRDTGRQAGPISVHVEGETVNLTWHEAWVPLSRDRLDFFIEVCEGLKESMQLDAGKAQVILNGEVPVQRWGIT